MLKQIKFPNIYEVIHMEAKEHAKLSAAERLRIQDEMMQLGAMMMRNNLNKERALELQEAEERAWAEAQLKILRRYESRHGA